MRTMCITIHSTFLPQHHRPGTSIVLARRAAGRALTAERRSLTGLVAEAEGIKTVRHALFALPTGKEVLRNG